MLGSVGLADGYGAHARAKLALLRGRVAGVLAPSL